MLALKYSKKRQGIRDGSRAISLRRQWVNMNRGSLQSRSFRHIHLLVLGTALQDSGVFRSFNNRPRGDWDGNKQQPKGFTNMHVCSDRKALINLVACVLKRRNSRKLEMFLFCLWKKFTVSIMHLRVFNFSAYETELELNLRR